MQQNITLTYKSTKRQFNLSSRTKPKVLKMLIKKAFHLQSQIRHLKHINGGVTLDIHEIFNFPTENHFEIFLDQDSDDRSRSEVCSQKNMSKHSGRKHPPSQRELLDSKFYVDDFQLFMSEVDEAKANRYFGIVFFSSKKKALFLGKKILRELVFEFDQIQFFYALHPIKMHNSSALLGRKMIHERQFPEQITAAQEIVSYLKNLVKVGKLNFKKKGQTNQKKKTKNLISVCEQRSFDQKNDVLPKQEKLNFQQKNSTTEFFKMNMINPSNRQIEQYSSPPVQLENIGKNTSPIANEISFETELYQPGWFSSGDSLTRIQKAFLSALIKEGNSSCVSFCQNLELKKLEKDALNKKLLKVFLKEVIQDRFQRNALTKQQIRFIQENQENRKSFVFSALLKLNRFGKIDQFVTSIKNQYQLNHRKSSQLLQKCQPPLPSHCTAKRNLITQKSLNSTNSKEYLNLIKQVQRKRKTFTIKLVQPDKGDELMSPQKQSISLFGKHPRLCAKNQEIARSYHMKSAENSNYGRKQIFFESDYQQAQKAHIRVLIQKGDAFLIQNFILNETSKKNFARMPRQTVKQFQKYRRKYLDSIQPRYANLRERTSLSTSSKNKLQKLQIFMSLLYFFYKQRYINKKQLKAFFYLYTWSDLNVLSAFQLYLQDRDIDEIFDTLYAVDFTYYNHSKYGIDMNEVENFSVAIESQLIMLFLISDQLKSVQDRLASQKFIRAGDTSLYKIYHDFSLSQEQYLEKSTQLCSRNRFSLEQHTKNTNKEEIYREQRNKERCNFIEQIIPAHFKHLKEKVKIIHECIQLDQPKIHEMFDIFDQKNQLVKWIEGFKEYSSNIDQYHKNCLLKKWCEKLQVSYIKLLNGGIKPEVLKGIYESYMVTADQEDAIDSVDHVFKKMQKDQKKQSSASASPAQKKSRKESAGDGFGMILERVSGEKESDILSCTGVKNA